MNPLPGQFVKVLFNNNTFMEGTVVKWSDEKSVLKDDNSVFIIQKTAQDVMMIEVQMRVQQPAPQTTIQQSAVDMSDGYPEDLTESDIIKIEEGLDEDESSYQEYLVSRFNDVAKKPKKTVEDLRTLAELKGELNCLELEDYSQQIKSHIPSDIPKVNYAYPNFSAQQPPFKRTSKKNTRKNFPGDTGLSRLFKSKDKI